MIIRFVSMLILILKLKSVFGLIPILMTTLALKLTPVLVLTLIFIPQTAS